MVKIVAVYTKITPETLEIFLRGFDLGSLISLKGIAEGVENSNYDVKTEGGRFILTLYEKRVRREDLPYFLHLMQYLSEQGFPSPVPQKNRLGLTLHYLGGKPAALVNFLSGASVKTASVQHCREAGRALSELHQAARGFSQSRPNDFGVQAWPDLLQKAQTNIQIFHPEEEDLLQQDIHFLIQNWPSDLPRGTIHADLFLDNLFFTGDRFAAMIDFYFACEDFLAYDLAIALNAWCDQQGGGLQLDKARAFFAGYEGVRPLSSAEKKAIPILAYGAAMRFFLTRMIDWNLALNEALVQPKNPQDYLDKLRFYRRKKAELSIFGLSI